MKKIIYIPPSFKIKKKNYFNLIFSIIYDFATTLNNFNKKKKLNNGTDGFLEQSINSNFKVFVVPYFISIFFANIINRFFDGIFINWKFTNLRNDKNLENKLFDLCKKFKIKKVLVDTRDNSNLINDKLTENFDLIIQREKLKKIVNPKILSTMLPCPLINLSNFDKFIDWKLIGRTKPNNEFKFDIFFSGKNTNNERIKLIKKLQKLNLNLAGGLSEKKIPYPNYLDMIYNSAINIAPEGIGIFTFRHLEILASCSFLMCPSSINKIELPIPLLDEEDFVSYCNLEDLEKKINFYIKKPILRKKISSNGRKKLEKYYSPKKHGKEILNKLF